MGIISFRLSITLKQQQLKLLLQSLIVFEVTSVRSGSAKSKNVYKMKAFVLCVAIQIVAETNAFDWLFDQEWREFDNFCVSQFNEDLLGSPMPAGDANIEICKSICNKYNSTNYCTAIEWYNNGWNGVKCFLILDDTPASQGFDGTRWRDATCHVKADCDSNKDCPWDRPICLGFNGKFYGKCVLNGQIPNSQGCWIKYPSGCPNKKNNSKYNKLQDGRIWNRDTYNGASTSRDKCSARRGPINSWCGVSDVVTHYVSETCQPKDSDTCIKEAWKAWDWSKGCEESHKYNPKYCRTWGKDMRRCCPETCKSGKFTKEDCDMFPFDGTCSFPTSATICNDVIRSPCRERKCGSGCYIPNLDSCLDYGRADCMSNGGISCKESCKDSEDCGHYYYPDCKKERHADVCREEKWEDIVSFLSVAAIG